MSRKIGVSHYYPSENIRPVVIRFFDDNKAALAELNIDATLAALLRSRYRDQPTRFEWGYNPDALKQQDRWQNSLQEN